jgi:hypothetical protein
MTIELTVSGKRLMARRNTALNLMAASRRVDVPPKRPSGRGPRYHISYAYPKRSSCGATLQNTSALSSTWNLSRAIVFRFVCISDPDRNKHKTTSFSESS